MAKTQHGTQVDLADLYGYRVAEDEEGGPVLLDHAGRKVDTWRQAYPYDEKLSRAEYEPAKRALQIELLKLQRHVRDAGERVVIVFEGRDAAGKGGTIKRFIEHLNPRGTEVVALNKPTERESTEWYFQRYVAHLPAAGEIVLFDRSWYNRAVVEHVMGFCTDEQYRRFLNQVPAFERMLVDDGVQLTKFWFSVSREEQQTRFAMRQVDPVRRWKLSLTDLDSLPKWDEYTAAKEAMFAASHTPEAPWTVVRSNDKKRGRLEALRWVLSSIDYPDRDPEAVGTVDRRIVGPPSEVYEAGEHEERATRAD